MQFNLPPPKKEHCLSWNPGCGDRKVHADVLLCRIEPRGSRPCNRDDRGCDPWSGVEWTFANNMRQVGIHTTMGTINGIVSGAVDKLAAGKAEEAETILRRLQADLGKDPATRIHKHLYVANAQPLAKTHIDDYLEQLIRRQGGPFGVEQQQWVELERFFHGDPASLQTFVARSDEEMMYALRMAKEFRRIFDKRSEIPFRIGELRNSISFSCFCLGKDQPPDKHC